MDTEKLIPGNFYHIYNRGNNREDIFKEEKNYDYFLQKFKYYLTPYLNIYAYCLMPNHFHFLIEIKENTDLKISEEEYHKEIQNAFRIFFMSYSKAINKSYDRTGSLFQYKFKRKLIDKEDYFTQLILYIHFNPVKAKLCPHCEEWKYSSYNASLSDKETMVQRKKVLEWFGGKDGFILSHKLYIGEEIKFISEWTK